MKANELMIGDIVIVNNTPLKIAALGTQKAGFIDAKGEMFYHAYENLKPMRPTIELMKKNGFVLTVYIEIGKKSNHCRITNRNRFQKGTDWRNV